MSQKTSADPTVGELIKSARACEAKGQYGEAHRLLQQCAKLVGTDAANIGLIRSVQNGLWRLAPLWWTNIQHGGVCLRRCQAEDADFFRRCFNDALFRRQFNRLKPWRGDLEQALQKSGKLPPIQTGLLMWVIQSSSSGPVGLASLSSIDTMNRRAELSIGFPGEVPVTLGVKTTLMMLHYALIMMPFNKIYAYVYEDNPKALHNAIRFGFVHEGKLNDHFNIPGHGFVTVDLIGLTRSQLLAHANLKALAKQKIGQSW